MRSLAQYMNNFKRIEPRFKVGTQFKKAGRKNQAVHTIVDFYVAHNLQGEVISKRYKASCSFLGQTIWDNDVLETTIVRGLTKDAAI